MWDRLERIVHAGNVQTGTRGSLKIEMVRGCCWIRLAGIRKLIYNFLSQCMDVKQFRALYARYWVDVYYHILGKTFFLVEFTTPPTMRKKANV